MIFNKKIIIVLILASVYSFFAIPNLSIANSSKIVKVDLPEIPQIWEIHKNLVDEYSTAYTEGSDQNLNYNNNNSSIKKLRGFIGSQYLSNFINRDISIVEKSINFLKTDNWEVLGLVRNETSENLDGVKISAELFDNNGKLLERVSTETLVNNIRPGEPSPFNIKSSINREMVYDVKWEFVKLEINDEYNRDFNILINYEIPFGVSQYMGIKRNDYPYPYILGTSFDLLSGEISSGDIIVAWNDSEGKIIWIEESSLSILFKDGVKKDGSGLFEDITVLDQDVAKKLIQQPFTVWAVGR